MSQKEKSIVHILMEAKMDNDMITYIMLKLNGNENYLNKLMTSLNNMVKTGITEEKLMKEVMKITEN